MAASYIIVSAHEYRKPARQDKLLCPPPDRCTFPGADTVRDLVLLISWSGIKAIQTNYGLQKQISGLKQQNAVIRLQNENLALKNQYYNSDQYLELSARQNFGLAVPGEKEINRPQKRGALVHRGSAVGQTG